MNRPGRFVYLVARDLGLSTAELKDKVAAWGLEVDVSHHMRRLDDADIERITARLAQTDDAGTNGDGNATPPDPLARAQAKVDKARRKWRRARAEAEAAEQRLAEARQKLAKAERARKEAEDKKDRKRAKEKAQIRAAEVALALTEAEQAQQKLDKRQTRLARRRADLEALKSGQALPHEILGS